jgi:hypothetical protein
LIGGWGIVVFWLGTGIGLGEEMNAGVTPVTFGNILIFMAWATAMVIYTSMMASVSTISWC